MIDEESYELLQEVIRQDIRDSLAGFTERIFIELGAAQILEFVVKLHDFTGDHEDHSLANVHHAVSSPFQVMGHPDKITGSINQFGVDHDIGGQLAEDLVIESIHFIIFHRNRSGQFGIPSKEGLKRLCAACCVLSRPCVEYRSEV